MKRNPNFEIVQIANENLAIPVGEASERLHGVVVLSKAAAFLLNHMESAASSEELVSVLVNEYNVSKSVADRDVKEGMKKLISIGVVTND